MKNVSQKELDSLKEKAFKARTDLVMKYGSTPEKIKGNHIVDICKKRKVSVMYGNTIKEPSVMVGTYSMDFWEFIDGCN